VRNVDHSREPTPGLPELTNGWRWVALGDLAASESNSITDGPFGSKLKTEHYTDDGPRVIRLQNIGDGLFRDERACISESHFRSLQKHRIYGGDLVIAALGEELPRSCIIPDWVGPAIVKADCIRFKPHADLALPKFLNFALNFEQTRKRTGNIVHGVGRPRLNLTEIRGVFVPLTSINEQRRIVAKIDELFSDLDAGVAALERVRGNLKRYRAAVLKAAVEGKLTEDWRAQHPDTEPASVLLDRILTDRRRQWEKDQLAKFAQASKRPPTGWQLKYDPPQVPHTASLPSLPSGWIWASIDQLADVGTGTTPSRTNKAFYSEGSIPWITSTAVNAPYVHEASELVTQRALNETTLRLYPPGTLIVALYGEGKTRGKVSELMLAATINQALASLVMEDALSGCRPYLKSFLAANYEQLRRQAAGGMQPNLNLGLVRALAVALPPLEEQRVICAELERRLSIVDEIEAQVAANLKRAARLRQGILKRAFEGRLVPQDPDDEPACNLLERIRRQRPKASPSGNGNPRPRRSGRPRKGERTLPLFIQDDGDDQESVS
jgi:type I restriction enzyme, S subunit